MQSMNCGTMPDRKAFADAFARECPEGRFLVREGLGGGFAEVSFSEQDLRAHVRRLARRGCYEPRLARNDASAILYVLGFEWV